MWAPQHRIIRTSNPEATAIQQMGKAAREASDTFTLREWAGLLAARAGPRDFLGQLRQLYDGVLGRSRYVMESGEWIDGSARTLLGHMLGAKYNRGPTCPSPERCSVERTPWRQRGWGDCDSYASLMAAGIRALGMRAYFRTIRNDRTAHVAAVAQLPDGRMVSLDPVGHPQKPFGWAMRGGMVRYWNLSGQPVPTRDLEPQMIEVTQ